MGFNLDETTRKTHFSQNLYNKTYIILYILSV